VAATVIARSTPPARVAALYDIHGNLPALEAVLADVRAARVDRIVIGGDVLPGPMPRECLDSLLALAREVPTTFISGNGEREVLARLRGVATGGVPEAFREVIRWSGEQLQLQPEYESLVATWPPTARLEMADVGAILFCHASPRNDVDVFTRLTPADRLLPLFAAVDAEIVICGHSHMQFDRTIGRTRVVNAGSVGMSFQGPGAFWLLLGPGPEIDRRRTAYDPWAAADRIRATGYPQADDFATRNVLDPPSEAAMLDAFAKVELK
jgi:predicted phosphodiesterase